MTLDDLFATLTVTVGLPASGKSTWARQQQNDDPSLVLVSLDEIRAMLHQSLFNRDNEKLTQAVESAIIETALSSGRSIIVHDTNLNPYQLKRLRGLASTSGARFRTKDFTNVSADECKRRDALRPEGERVGSAVIDRMVTDQQNEMGRP
jgi:predicted kinase